MLQTSGVILPSLSKHCESCPGENPAVTKQTRISRSWGIPAATSAHNRRPLTTTWSSTEWKSCPELAGVENISGGFSNARSHLHHQGYIFSHRRIIFFSTFQRPAFDAPWQSLNRQFSAVEGDESLNSFFCFRNLIPADAAWWSLLCRQHQLGP